MQTKLSIQNNFSSKNGEYFQSPPRRHYKERNRYNDRRNTTPKLLEEFGVKVINQRTWSCPLVWSNDKMSINTPKEIKQVIKKTYSQDWEAYNQAQTHEKVLFLELLHELTSNIPDQKYKGNGRPPANIGEMIFSKRKII